MRGVLIQVREALASSPLSHLPRLYNLNWGRGAGGAAGKVSGPWPTVTPGRAAIGAANK